MTLQELKEYVLAHYDSDDLVDALEIGAEELLDAFENKLEQNSYKFIGDDE